MPRIARVLAVVVAFLPLLAALSPARASCFPQIHFSQVATGAYRYVLFPEGTPATPVSIVGRLWQPGLYAGTNQGTCDETHWLIRCNDDCAPHPGPAFYIDGLLGGMACTSGCPDGEMILLLEERGSGGGLFLAARVDESPGSLFDFSRLGVDLVPVPIPKPRIQGWSQGVATVQLDDPAPGFFGLPGVPAWGTISAFHVLVWRGLGSPPMDPAAWTDLVRLPYTGGTTSGAVAIGDPCPANGARVFLAAALELDGGQVLTEYISQPASLGCIPERWFAGGHVPEGGAEGLQVSRSSPGDLTLTWSPSCVPNNIAAVYEGTLGDWTSHVPRDCAVGPTTTTFPEPENSAYYLVVPQTVNLNPPDVEGSYGLLRDGSERPQSAQACLPQVVVECP
jgi:hypothetical protein